MKIKRLNALLLFSSIMVYLEWSNRYCFAIQAEAEVLCRLLHATKSVMPPLTLLPIIGHLFLFFTCLLPAS